MPTELERSRGRLADAVLRIVSTSSGTDVTSLARVASEALEEIIGYPSAFEPVVRPLGFTVSFEQLTRNDATAVVSYHGVERGRVTVDRPCGGMGAFGNARFLADQVRHRWSWAGELQADGKTDEVVREARREAEKAEATLRAHVLANPNAFLGPSRVARRVHDWLKDDQREIAPLVKALAT